MKFSTAFQADPDYRDQQSDEPHKTLARAVIQRGLLDLFAPGMITRREARQFIRSEDLEFWCEVGDMDPARVRLMARTDKRPGTRGRVKGGWY